MTRFIPLVFREERSAAASRGHEHRAVPAAMSQVHAHSAPDAGRRGWLRGTFCLNVVNPTLERLGLPMESPGPEVTVAFVKRSRAAQLADPAESLFDEGLTIKEIARRLGIGRSLATKAVEHQFGEHGQTMPDRRVRRSALSALWFGRPRHQREVDQIMQLYEQGALLQDIATAVGLDRNMVTKAIRWWHETRGLSAPNGRT